MATVSPNGSPRRAVSKFGRCAVQQKSSRGQLREDFALRDNEAGNYGLGLDDVVVVVVDEEFEDGLVVVVFVLVLVFVVSLVFSFTTVEPGFTTVVLFSVFLSAAGGATTVFSSHPPRSAAPAKMQINFFIGFWIVAHVGAKPESVRANFSALPKPNFRRRLPLTPHRHEAPGAA